MEVFLAVRESDISGRAAGATTATRGFRTTA
jgi:hypothetical protein